MRHDQHHVAPVSQSLAGLDDRLSMEAPVQHFDLQNLHQIKDTEPHSWATVRADDATTFSELARCGFHLIDMRGETWTMHRE